MTTVANLLTNIRKVYGDTAGDSLTDAIGLTWYDEAQKVFCSKAWPLHRYRGFTVVANQESFAIPDENIIIELVVNQQGTSRILKYVSPRDFFTQKMAVSNAIGTPMLYTHFEGRIHVFPSYSSASKTTTTGEAVQASVASITLASNANLRSYGKVKINSEEINYEKKGSVFIAVGTRADGGTTAASHASGDTVTQMDLEVLHRRHPVALSSSAEPEIPEVYHETLNHYVLYLAYMSEGQEKKATFFLNMFNASVEEARKNVQRKALEEKAIRSIHSQRIAGLYGAV